MKYTELKNKTYRSYKKIKQVYCPYMKTTVVFNAKGFWHMIYTGRNEKRDISTQKLRFILLKKAVAVIRITTTLQEYEKEPRIEYHGFIAIIDNWKIKVIVKKIGNGALFFWSVIPNWRTRRKEKFLFKGDMEKD